MRARALLALALALPLALGGCAGIDQRGSASARMNVWVRTTGFGEQVGQLRATSDLIAQLAETPSSTRVLSTRCGVLLVDVQANNGDLPSPDRGVTQQLAKVYTAYAKAALACAEGARAGSPRPSAAVLSGLASASASLLEVLNRIEITTGRAVATSTTVPPAG